MAILKISIIAVVLLAISFANAQDSPRKFALQVDTGSVLFQIGYGFGVVQFAGIIKI